MKEFKGVQAEILKAKKSNQLVSAGAGSGKTTVMIEKIANLLIDGETEVENLLVVTFTVLAGQEMRDRLVSKLKEVLNEKDGDEKERILTLLEKVNTASIDTIDGFSSKTIKKYFYDLNISPNIEIISDATRDYYLTRAMKKTLDETSAENLNIMLDFYGGNKRNLDKLEEMVLSTYYNVINLEDEEAFLKKTVDEYTNSFVSEKIVNSKICSLASYVRGEIISEFNSLEDFTKEKLQGLLEGLDKLNDKICFKANLRVLLSLEKPKFTQKDYKNAPFLKSLKRKIDSVFDLKDDLIENEIDENFEEKNEKIINYLLIFINLLQKFMENYKKIKEKNNLIDFNDLNRLMLKLLENEKICDELHEKYHYIFIDEYQDINPLQGKLLSKLKGQQANAFKVGDVKQSIYGFRGATPELFLGEYGEMKTNSENEDVFDMNINFRSSPKILNFINEVFSVLMTKEVADIDYKKDCMIEPKREDIVDDKVKILLVRKNKEGEVAKGIYSVKEDAQSEQFGLIKNEAMMVVKTITELVGKPFYDANLKQVRNLTYSDFAILSHSNKDENSLALIDLLKAHAIPLNLNNKLDVNESEIVRLVLSILKCANNTADDVDYLATMMCLTDLTLDDVIEVRDKNFSFYENLIKYQENSLKNNENALNFDIFSKICEGFNLIDDILQASYSRTNKELICYILNEKKLKYYILAKPNGEKELNLLNEFVQKISPLEDGLGLCEFVEVVESNVSSSGEFASSDKEDSVTIQTIHKSKGLEYPVVILFNSSKLFSYIREKDAINFNSEIGLGMDYFDTANRNKMESLTKFAISLTNAQKGYKEELRLLYVALTRAKNKLFITGTVDNIDFDKMKKTSYTNMLLMRFEDQITGDVLEKDNFVLEFIDEIDVLKNEDVEQNKDVEFIAENFEYVNPQKFHIPIKNTVTGINREAVEKFGFQTKQIATKLNQYEVEDKAKVGVEYHSALEFLDLQAPYLQNTEFNSVDYSKIKLAHEKLSPLTKGAIKIKKEAQFMMWVPYCDVVKSDIQDKVLIQGVVDLIVEKEKSIILVDYKFSSLNGQVLKEKYAEQLRLYKMAIEKAFNKPVEQMFIYSINTGELI